MKEKLNQLKQLLWKPTISARHPILSWDDLICLLAVKLIAATRLPWTASTGKFTDPAIGGCDQLGPRAKAPYDSDEASLIRVTRRSYERLTKLPVLS
jgi:carboxypeptidase Taq